MAARWLPGRRQRLVSAVATGQTATEYGDDMATVTEYDDNPKMLGKLHTAGSRSCDALPIQPALLLSRTPNPDLSPAPRGNYGFVANPALVLTL